VGSSISSSNDNLLKSQITQKVAKKSFTVSDKENKFYAIDSRVDYTKEEGEEQETHQVGLDETDDHFRF
jgi:hypothetical protein